MNEEATGQPPFPPSTDDHICSPTKRTQMTSSRQAGLQFNPHPIHLRQPAWTNQLMTSLIALTSSD